MHIPARQVIRVLGVHFSNTAHNPTAVSRLIAAGNQVARMIKRLTSKNYGMEKTESTKLVSVFVVSRYTYVAHFLNLKPREEDRLDWALRNCVKLSLGVPVSTSNERLVALGVYNTTKELIDAQRSATGAAHEDKNRQSHPKQTGHNPSDNGARSIRHPPRTKRTHSRPSSPQTHAPGTLSSPQNTSTPIPLQNVGLPACYNLRVRCRPHQWGNQSSGMLV
ncbi:hypothetical protein HPB48_021720 [Haemaphysalis longicornis]|uniref:Tick transposon n=1 Tax=Haemaphysalis longicornis TaxID=44386 RepID=A0A9J6FXP6_HAELO|nr:hypothetical protein HPB48_021720 [Haemaphysalis longicornis]